MKQVLLQANNNYLFKLPDTYTALVKETCNRVNIPEHQLLLYYNGSIVNKNNFIYINKDLNILDVSVKLKGGVNFPSVMKLLGVLISLSIVLVIALFFLVSFILSVTTYIANGSKGNTIIEKIFEIFSSIKYIPKWSTLSSNDLSSEFLFFSLVIYIFSSIPIFTILSLKQKQCPSFKPPWKTLLLTFFSPFPLWIIFCLFVKSDTGNNPYISALYWVTGALFFASGIIITMMSANELQKWDKENNIVNLNYIPFSAGLAYFILRVSSIWRNNTNNFGWELAYIIITFMFTSLAASAAYVDAYMNYTSGLTLCT